VRLQHELTHAVLHAPVVHGAEQSEVATFPVHCERACRERDILARAVALLPHGEAQQLETVELAADEMDFGVSELVLRFVVLIPNDVDGDRHCDSPWMARAKASSSQACASCAFSSVSGAPSRSHSQSCSLFSPTRTGSASANRCPCSRHRRRWQERSVVSTRISRAFVLARQVSNAISSMAIPARSESIDALIDVVYWA